MTFNPIKRVLFVDDEVCVLDGLRRSLGPTQNGWDVTCATSVDEALEHARHQRPHAVVSDIMMPVRSGFDLLDEFARDEQLRHTPVVILTGIGDAGMKREALARGAVDLLSKPVQREDLIARLVSVLRIEESGALLREQAELLEARVRHRTRELEQARMEVLLRLAIAGEYRDDETGRHVVRVAHVARALADALGLAPAVGSQLLLTAPLHDIGKIAIADEILLKRGPLTQGERLTMQGHCLIGQAILCGGLPAHGGAFLPLQANSENALLAEAGEIAATHHERWDGTGYPNGLKGEEIPLIGRLVAVADVFDALTNARSYKPAIAFSTAQRLMRRGRGTHFDPEVWAAAERRREEFVEIAHALADPEPARQGAA